MRDLWMFLARLLFIVITLSLVYGFVHALKNIGVSLDIIGVIIFFIFFILVKLNGGKRI